MAEVPRNISQGVRQRYAIERNTFRVEKVTNPKRRHAVEIGDSTQDDFYPQVKLTGWDNEVNLSIRLLDDFQGVVRTQQDKILYENGSRTARFYEIDDTDFEDGAFEFDLVLSERPPTNVIEFTVQAKNLKAYFQPELTQEEIEQGAQRPERIVRSWAIYHGTERNNRLQEIAENTFDARELAQGLAEGWLVKKELSAPRELPDGTEVTEVLYELDKDVKGGKFGHIPRPYYTDANGNIVWCDFELPVDEENNIIDGGMARLFLPDEYKTAAYPIVVDPTFGMTSIAGSQGDTSRLRAQKFTAPTEAGEITTVHVYTRQAVVDTGTVIGTGVYAADASVQNSSLIAADTGNATLDVSASWETLNISAEFTASQDLLLAAQSDGQWRMYYDSGSNHYQQLPGTWETWPDPWGAISSQSYIFSIYATYTASAADYTLTADAGTFTLTGTASTLLHNKKLTAGSGSFTLSGTNASVLHNRTLTANGGTYSLTGTDATLLHNKTLVAGFGSNTLTGANTSLLHNRRLSAQSGSFTLTGADATLTYNTIGNVCYLLQENGDKLLQENNDNILLEVCAERLVADSGSFTLTGTDANLLLHRVLSAESGSYSLSGTDATLTYVQPNNCYLLQENGDRLLQENGDDLLLEVCSTADYTLTADPGSYSLTGTAATFRHNRVIDAEAGSFTLTGTDASLLHHKVLTAGGGSFTLSGTAATLIYTEVNRTLECEPGVFTLTGTAATLCYSGSPWTDVERNTSTWSDVSRNTSNWSDVSRVSSAWTDVEKPTTCK